MPEYPIRYRLPVSYSTEIGRIITRWAFLEYRLKQTVYMVVAVDNKVGRTAIRSPRAEEYVDMIQDLMKLKSLSTTIDLKTLRKNLAELRTLRDLFAHGIWLKHDSTKLPVVQMTTGSYPESPGGRKVKARIDPQAGHVTLSNLRKIRQSIEGTTVIIHQWKRDLASQL